MKILMFILLPLLCFGQLREEPVTHITPKKPETPLTCLIEDVHIQFYDDPGEVEVSNIGAHCISIYVETDYYTYQQFNSDISAVQTWIEDIIREVAIIYANEGLSIHLSSTYIPTSASEDWSSIYGNAADILYGFGALRGDTINGRLKHFFTRRGLGGGVAWINTLCTPQTFFTFGEGAYGPYAVSANLVPTVIQYPAYSWNVEVVAHEMGHNLGSNHTQNCLWGEANNMAIDDCVGQAGGPCDYITPINRSTIMSYCHLTSYGIDFTKGFGTEPGNLIRANVNNSCVSYVERLQLTNNVEGTYFADTITLDNVSTTGNLTLNANVVEISNSDIFPIFEIKSGCE